MWGQFQTMNYRAAFVVSCVIILWITLGVYHD